MKHMKSESESNEVWLSQVNPFVSVFTVPCFPCRLNISPKGNGNLSKRVVNSTLNEKPNFERKHRKPYAAYAVWTPVSERLRDTYGPFPQMQSRHVKTCQQNLRAKKIKPSTEPPWGEVFSISGIKRQDSNRNGPMSADSPGNSCSNL